MAGNDDGNRDIWKFSRRPGEDLLEELWKPFRAVAVATYAPR